VQNEFGPAPLHPLLAGRWSPASFDASHVVTADEIEALLEAARWAPSAGNSQPWAFIVGQRGDATHQRLVRHLAGSSARWAPSASLVVANLAHRYVEDTDWEFSEFSLYDLGEAVAHMTLQAQALGLSARQFRAFDRAGVAAEFDVPRHWEVTTMVAIGRPALATPSRPAPVRSTAVPSAAVPSAAVPSAVVPPDSEMRQRRAVGDIVWPVG
jgi:nitroreductase